MKKFVCLLAVMALTAPLFAADVDFSGDGAGSTLTLSYVVNAGDNPRGIGLKCTVLDGLVDIDTAGVTQDAAYNANIDYAYTEYTGGGAYNLGDGHPIADPCGAGVLPVTTGVRIFSICMGVLDPCQAPGPAAATLVGIPMSGSGSVTIRVEEDGLRGGVVGSALATNLPIDVVVTFEEEKCFPSDHPDYNAWLAAGEPDCWCPAPKGTGYQCRGDAHGDLKGDEKQGYFWVGATDLNVLAEAWQVKEDPKGPGIDSVVFEGVKGICADIAHDLKGDEKQGFFYVGATDLNELALYWQVKEPPKGDGVPPCF